ncbi:envelope-like protein [Cucumis melo var. makuwa]|uniref:Envelope-like protein n=1 Tax=Cucumis melo var. makuwa TaxID=1194695 RepID=A0A5A7TQ65_CUCMM|nr:envelope-like protein [Cucumis melo var. makuwa]
MIRDMPYGDSVLLPRLLLDDIVIQHPSNEELALEFSGGTIRSWPTEGQLLVVSLNRKYPILHKIGISNWIPSTHASIVSATMGHFIYFVGKEAQLNVGAHVPDLPCEFYHALRSGSTPFSVARSHLMDCNFHLLQLSGCVRP